MPIRHDRCFTPEPAHRRAALALYERVVDLPLVCPHGHVDPAIFADPDYRFASPAALFIIPDHYLLRLLYSQGIPLESLGREPRDGGDYERDHRRIWRTFAEHIHLFRGTPSGIWLREALELVFGITEKLTAQSADRIYDQIAAALERDDFTPRRLYERFNIEVLCTTDAATDTLEHHQSIRASGWGGRILPTFRPDALLDVHRDGWHAHIETLSALSGIDIVDYPSFLDALAQRRAAFRALGAVATDHGLEHLYRASGSSSTAASEFRQVISASPQDADRIEIAAQTLIEMADMSLADGLVMQLHIGSSRSHNRALQQRFGSDIGADIPVTTSFTYPLQSLLERVGNSPVTLILFTLDESTYSRELAPLAGHYPALRLGPPWWFHDSPNGMRRYFDQVMETASIYNTVGFNDDTRAFLSIPARHDLWRRMACDWLAGLLLRGIIDEEDAHDMAYELAYGLAKKAYRL